MSKDKIILHASLKFTFDFKKNNKSLVSITYLITIRNAFMYE